MNLKQKRGDFLKKPFTYTFIFSIQESSQQIDLKHYQFRCYQYTADGQSYQSEVPSATVQVSLWARTHAYQRAYPPGGLNSMSSEGQKVPTSGLFSRPPSNLAPVLLSAEFLIRQNENSTFLFL